MASGSHDGIPPFIYVGLKGELLGVVPAIAAVPGGPKIGGRQWFAVQAEVPWEIQAHPLLLTESSGGPC